MTSPHNNPQAASASSTSQLRGTVRVPGDKSISHRALMLASQALGTTTIHGLLEGEDVLRTAEALKQCGVPIAKKQDIWVVSGRGIGGLHEPTEVLDMGNAGTAARLMMGLLAPYPYNVQFTGDDSLKKRPMKRVITPLEQVGAEFLTREGGRLPLAMKGTATPMPITYELPVASAQVKSAILLAGLNTPGTTTVIEREATRDHTERMLRFFGVDVETQLITQDVPKKLPARTMTLDDMIAIMRDLRPRITDPGALLWEVLRLDQLGIKFYRDHPIGIGNYTADFMSPELKLVIELYNTKCDDEETFAKEYKARSSLLEVAGFKVLRFWNWDFKNIIEDMEGYLFAVVEAIEDVLQSQEAVQKHGLRTLSVITLTGQPHQTPQDRELHVPADPSSAAFPIVAALLVPNSEVTVTNVCLNPLRTGLFDVLKRMGADITISNPREVGGEPVGDITARTSQLREVDVPAHIAPSMIDEYPILAMAAACATGKSVMRGLSELRVKESDRLAAIIAGLNANGIEAHADGNDLMVVGKGGRPPGGGTVTTHYDHRIAMSFLILGLVAQQPVKVDDIRAIATSFPSFTTLMRDLGAKFLIDRMKERPTPERRMVITVDGPAASGKGSLARRLAYHFGLGYLDTGLLYRAVGMRVLYAHQDPKDVAAATAAARLINAQDLANPKLRGERIGQAASIVSAMPEVRQILLDYQRNFAASENGAVLDGRDTGTVICPDADYKFFITASLEARAKRRHKELQDYGITVDYQSVYDDLVERDARDATRSVAPMKPAEDAVVIDTSGLSMQEVFDLVMKAMDTLPQPPETLTDVF